jgi:hypothetical protein
MPIETGSLLKRVPPLTNADIWVCYLGVLGGSAPIAQMTRLVDLYRDTSEIEDLSVGQLSRVAELEDLSTHPILGRVRFAYTLDERCALLEFRQDKRTLLELKYVSEEVNQANSGSDKLVLTGKKERKEYKLLSQIALTEGFGSPSDDSPISSAYRKLWRGWHQFDFLQEIYTKRVLPDLKAGNVIQAVPTILN